MDQVYVCIQCGEESDIQAPCPMCGLPMVAAQDDELEDDVSFNEEGESEEAKEGHDDNEDEQDAPYNPYEE